MSVAECVKVRFADQHAANVAVTDAKLARMFHRNNRRKEDHAYRCTRCGGWHLTSMPATAWRV